MSGDVSCVQSLAGASGFTGDTGATGQTGVTGAHRCVDNHLQAQAASLPPWVSHEDAPRNLVLVLCLGDVMDASDEW